MRRLVKPAVGCLAALALLGGCSAAEPPAPAPVQVTVMRAEQRAEPLPLAYSGRLRGTREVEVRARVSGILERRYYQEGDHVAAGARLFRIDPAPYAAAVRAAQGRLGIETARLAETTRQRTRVAALHGRGFVSGRNRDLAESDHGAAQAAVSAARAELERARLDLSYTEVVAPISGVTGLESRSEGSLIDATAPDSSLLTTIAQTDGLHVDFSMPEPEAQLLRAAMRGGAVSVGLLATGADTPLGSARVNFVDTRVDTATGTVTVRASLDNAGARLSPGQFVRVALRGLTGPVGIYLPARAIGHGADGAFVWKIDGKGLAAIQPVTTGESIGNRVRIQRGVSAGDRIIVEGGLKLQPGSAVRATPAARP